MKLVCVHSRVTSFKVGDIVNSYQCPIDKGGSLLVDGRTSLGWFLNSDDGLSIGSGSGDPFATFKPFQKSLRKMMVRAFVKYAKDRGWGDSKNGARYSWSGNAFNNANDWARNWADGYFWNDGTPIEAFAEHFEPGQQITQHDIDGYVDEEMSYL